MATNKTDKKMADQIKKVMEVAALPKKDSSSTVSPAKAAELLQEAFKAKPILFKCPECKKTFTDLKEVEAGHDCEVL